MKRFLLNPKDIFHYNVIQAGNEAFGAWCRAWAWSCRYETEGVLHDNLAKTIAHKRVWRTLEAHGLVVRHGEGWKLLRVMP